MLTDDESSGSKVRPRSIKVLQIARELMIGAIIVIGLNIGFALATLTVNAAVPHSALRARLVHFVATGQITGENWPLDFTGNQLDGYSDCTGVSLNVIGPVDRSPRQMLSDADVVGANEFGQEACEVLVTLGTADASALPVYRYFRYWHGYQILTKPLLLFVEFKGLRTICSLLYIVSVLGFFFVTVPKRGRLLTATFLASGFVLLTSAENLDGALVNNLALMAAFVGAVALYHVAKHGSLRSIFRAGLGIAACIGFVDQNYVPPLAAMVLAFAALSAVCHSGRDDTYALAMTLGVVLFAWVCGYLGTMVLRVAVSALIQPDPAEGLHDFISQLFYRLSGEVPWAVGIFAPILRNLRIVAINPFLPGVIVGAVVLVVERVVRGWRFGQSHATPAYLLVAALPLPWYMIFWQYSVIHDFIFYRWAAFGLVCLIATILFSLRPPESDSALRKRSRTRGLVQTG